jgi:SAM-dependent methyltransferase
MGTLIRINLKDIIESGEKVVLELGCGRKKKEGRIGIDQKDFPNVDVVTDLEEGLGFLPNKSVDEIYCKSLLEHITNFEQLMSEIIRVLKNDGKAHIFVPHFSNPYYFSDYTHKRFFGLYTFYYFVDTDHQLKRKVPDFYSGIKIRILSQRLVFKSPFRLRRQGKKLFSFIFNAHRSLSEFYEENLCYIFPCYGIEVVFSPALHQSGRQI